MLAESLLLALGMLSTHAVPARPAAHQASFPLARYIAPPVIAPVRKTGSSTGIATTGKAAVLLDGKSGATLYTKEGSTVHPIASLTKLMTAMVVLDAGQSLEEVLEVLAEDEPNEGRTVIGRGERLTREALLDVLLVGSVNTAGNTLARNYPGGREAFLQAMNQKAQELGMTQAVFTDPTGLDRGNRASAIDVARLLRQALQYPQIRSITKHATAKYSNTQGKTQIVQNTNLLLSSFLNKAPYTILAGKTGSLPEAGFCFAQATQDAAGNELIAVTLASQDHFSRYQDVKALTAWGFESFSWE